MGSNPVSVEDESKRSIVAAAYRALLKREPDDGIEYHLERLKSSEATAYEEMLVNMQQSPEYKRRILDLMCANSRVDRVRYSQVVSLGTRCYTAFLLKYAGLRFAAHPFDWIFSNQEMVNHCLADDFAEFLNEQNFCPVPLSERIHGADYNKTHNLYYLREYGVRFVYNHHSMDMVDTEYFKGAVDRFRALMKSDKSKLLLQCIDFLPGSKRSFRHTSEIIDRFSVNAKLIVVAVSAEYSDSCLPSLKVEDTSGQHEFYVLRPTSRWGTIDFDDPVDDLAILRLVESQGLPEGRNFFPWSAL